LFTLVLLGDWLSVDVDRLVLRARRVVEGCAVSGTAVTSIDDPPVLHTLIHSSSSTTYQLPELRRAPGVVLHETPLHRLSKVLLEAVRERTLRLLKLRRRERQPRILVLAHVLQLLHVLTHLVEEVLRVLVVRVDTTLELLLRNDTGGARGARRVA
jgi:hypothetical protein